MLRDAMEDYHEAHQEPPADEEDLALLAGGKAPRPKGRAKRRKPDVEGQAAPSASARERLLRQIAANPSDAELLRQLRELCLGDAEDP